MSQQTLDLPPGFDPDAAWRYHGRDWYRDRDAPAERVAGPALTKALEFDGRAYLLTLTAPAGGGTLVMGMDSDDPLILARAQRVALRMLGLTPALADAAAGLEARASRDATTARLVGRRRGYRPPLAATVFEALAWAIIGQQINLTFAADLRRQLILLAGRPHPSGMIAHPEAAAVAALDPELLTARRFSRSKARYLIDAAQAAVDGRLDLAALERLDTDPVGEAAAEAALLALRGIGPWTTNYVLMRGCGLPDRVPVGDAGLAAALQRFHAMDRRPTAEEQAALMRPHAPWRSLATAHLWASLA
ncbi:DNA-3-methyladenine glycosylase family protein [Nitrospirillum viridazoti]|uniref:DNA-3-methyladenine glycosylase II n=1 Tax=Nitrospirillum viridazoti CBAmc TaxID=1441467 RepID=A0A248JWQ5_9PROT|nr:DNA-3-methyladenine glycosylase [Nitrospirillum amazonense]ASG23152.1 DNA repair protein [Nitrospirillum amazonense CBAmc]TWB38900.1 DNA-3-methyladenine glycosylase II [Nitrospirillum amazonense]